MFIFDALKNTLRWCPRSLLPPVLSQLGPGSVWYHLGPFVRRSSRWFWSALRWLVGAICKMPCHLPHILTCRSPIAFVHISFCSNFSWTPNDFLGTAAAVLQSYQCLERVSFRVLTKCRGRICLRRPLLLLFPCLVLRSRNTSEAHTDWWFFEMPI